MEITFEYEKSFLEQDCLRGEFGLHESFEQFKK